MMLLKKEEFTITEIHIKSQSFLTPKVFLVYA